MLFNSYTGKTKKTAKKNLAKRGIWWLVLIFWSMAIGSGISQAQGTSEAKPAEIGKEVYLEHCASCHIPIPPEVLPTQTWQELLEKPQNHYGENLKDIISITQRLIWEYLRLYSRPLNPEEKTPMYIAQSRYFKALHPRVEVPKPVNHQSCNSCHIGVQNLDYRSLTPPWENSP